VGFWKCHVVFVLYEVTRIRGRQGAEDSVCLDGLVNVSRVHD